jgi:hypothetical protein
MFQEKVIEKMLYAFLWVVHKQLWFKCQCFGTHCMFYLHRGVGMKLGLRVWGFYTGKGWLRKMTGVSRKEVTVWGRLEHGNRLWMAMSHMEATGT